MCHKVEYTTVFKIRLRKESENKSFNALNFSLMCYYFETLRRHS